MSRSRSGIVAMLLSAVFFTLMGAFIRGLPDINSYVLVMARFIIGSLVCVGLFLVGLDRPRWTNWPWLVARGAVGSVAVVLLYWGIQNVGLGKATVIMYTYPMFGAMMGVPLLGERLRPGHWGAVAVALLGVTLLFGVRDFHVTPGDGLVLFAAMCSGFAVVAIARCRETDSSTNIFWSQSLFGIAAAAWPVARHWALPAPAQFGLILAVGILAAAGQLFMTYAYKHTGAANGSLLSLVTPVLTGVIAVLYFREPCTWGFVAGTALILTACSYMALKPVERLRGQAGISPSIAR
jgi:drug/metabolite transporter (DMT)-like permease